MFIEEIKAKLNLENKIFPYTITMLGGDAVYICGVKTVLVATETEVKLRFPNINVKIEGENLNITAIGGGDVFLKGRITNVSFE